MDIPAYLMPAAVINVSYLLFAVLMLAAVITAPWHKIRDSSALNVYLGAVVCLLLLWSMRAGIQPGLSFHLLGATALCLMFGWQFALFAVGLITAGITLNGSASWGALPLNVLMMGGLPVLVTITMLYLAQRFLPHNFFIYIFINAFIAAALSNLTVALSAYWLFRLTEVYPLAILNSQYLPFMVLVAIPEGTLNGMIMTATVVYRPEWVATFHDRWYLYKK